MNDTLRLIVAEAAVDLFAAYAVSVRPLPAPGLKSTPVSANTVDPAKSSAASVKFGGKELNGRLLLVSSFELMAECRPRSKATPSELSPSSAGDWIYVRDWTKELTNQLIGRIKNLLVPYGVTLEAGTPLPYSGQTVVAEVKTRKATPIRLVADRHFVDVWFDVVITPGFILTKSESDSPQREGEIRLF